MKIMVVWPPQIPSYFNAGHHISVYTTAEFLRQSFPDSNVVTEEFGLLNKTWKEIGDTLYQFSPDFLVIINDFDAVDDLDRFIAYTRDLVPNCKIITGGRLSSEVPEVFKQFDVDGVVSGGDIELGFAEYIRDTRQCRFSVSTAGVIKLFQDRWIDAAEPLRFAPSELPLPNVSEIPYNNYERLYLREENKFCGIPHRKELVVPVSRGCPINCHFCDVPAVQGLRDRRLSPNAVVNYIQSSMQVVTFDYISFYSPTFTFNRNWIMELCSKIQQADGLPPWKCATAIPHLDEDMIRIMAEAGCVRISLGIETLEPNAVTTLPKKKQTNTLKVFELAQVAEEVGIELNFFVIVGLPGTTEVGTANTFEVLNSLNARIRPTMYSDIHILRKCKDKQELWTFNRQLLTERSALSHSLYRFIFGNDTYTGNITQQIPHVSFDNPGI